MGKQRWLSLLLLDGVQEVSADTEAFAEVLLVVQISVSRTGPYGSSAAKNGPTGSAYITFKRMEDARRCIENIHSTVWEGGPRISAQELVLESLALDRILLHRPLIACCDGFWEPVVIFVDVPRGPFRTLWLDWHLQHQ